MKEASPCGPSVVVSKPSVPAPEQLGKLFRRIFCSNAKLLAWWPKGKGRNDARPFCRRFFSPVVVLWYLVFQRLSADHSLDAVVEDAHRGGADGLLRAVAREKRNKRIARLKSRSTSAYSQARQALPLEVVQEACVFLCREIAQLWEAGQKALLGASAGEQIRHIGLLDGTTISMRPCGDIADVFGGATNQHHRTYWCLMRVVGCFCLQSGAVMATLCGAFATGEIALTWQLMAEAAAGTIYVGDRGFGIYSIVERSRAYKHDVILRLTESRARRLLGRDSMEGEQIPVEWRPSRHDKLAPGAERKPVAGRLICVRLRRNGFRPDTLWLFTTLTDQKAYPLAQLVEWYGLRWNVELDFRYLKTQLQMNRLEVKSSQMAYKEFYAGIICYNLVRLFMYEAALKAGVRAMKLSFSSCRRLLAHSLCAWISNGAVLKASRLYDRLETLLKELGRCLLPKRKKPRPSEPRKVCAMPRTFPSMSRSRQLERAALTPS